MVKNTEVVNRQTEFANKLIIAIKLVKKGMVFNV